MKKFNVMTEKQMSSVNGGIGTLVAVLLMALGLVVFPTAIAVPVAVSSK